MKRRVAGHRIKVRGLLCSNCNAALGMLKDSISSCYALISYLRAAKATESIEKETK